MSDEIGRMAESNEASLSKQLEECKLGDGEEKKKKCRVKPGRHKKEKRRVAQRDRMNVEKDAKRDAERQLMIQVDEQRIQGIGSIKDVKSRSYNAYWSLQVAKTVLPVPKLTQSEARGLEHLSRQLITLLRWGLPSSGMTYHANDGSVSVSHLVQHFHVTQSVLIKATSPDAGRGKRRMIAFEERVVGTNKIETKVAALGGHGFHVPNPQGHKLIDKDDADLFAPLFHETDAREKIEKSSFLSAMRRQGGINFTSKRPGGYRSKADTLVTMDEKQLSTAIKSGLVFYFNEYSGLVFGVGKKKPDGTWDLQIPVQFVSISSN